MGRSPEKKGSEPEKKEEQKPEQKKQGSVEINIKLKS
jgi:hypothetical protein